MMSQAWTHRREPALTCGTASPTDPEVHIGLENLQHFPAFGSPPHNSSPPVQPDFTVDPPSPLSSSPSGELSLVLPCTKKAPVSQCSEVKTQYLNIFFFPSHRRVKISGSGRSEFGPQCGQHGGRLPLRVVCSGELEKGKQEPLLLFDLRP